MNAFKRLTFRCLSLLPIIAVAVFLSMPMPARALASPWTMQDLGAGAQAMNAVAVGPGRNDGVNRVYGGNADWHLYEFSYAAGAWNKVDAGTGSYNVQGLTSLAVTAGRYDGVTRVYSSHNWYYNGGWDTEFTYAAGNWSIQSIPHPASGTTHNLAVGDARGDGQVRVYTTGGYTVNQVSEATYAFSTWTATQVYAGGSHFRGITIGAGRNDGKNRLYVADLNGYVYEFTWTDGAWVESDLGSLPAELVGVTVGAGRNDGILRVYASSNDGHIYEYSYTGSGWTRADIGYGGEAMTSVTIGAGRGGTGTYVYGSNEDGHVYEFSYTGGGWSRTDLGYVNANVLSVAVGSGRSDSTPRVYAAYSDGHIREFSYAPFYQVYLPMLTK